MKNLTFLAASLVDGEFLVPSILFVNLIIKPPDFI